MMTGHNLSRFLGRQAGNFALNTHSAPGLKRTPRILTFDSNNLCVSRNLIEQVRVVSLIVIRITADHCRTPSLPGQLLEEAKGSIDSSIALWWKEIGNYEN